jgi:hypothetical protein
VIHGVLITTPPPPVSSIRGLEGTGLYSRSAGVWKASDILFDMRHAPLILRLAAWMQAVTPFPAVIVKLPDAGEMVFGSLWNLVLGFWIYRCPNFFAKLLWLKGFSPFRTDDDPMRLPPKKLVSFLKILGVIAMLAGLFWWLPYLVLRWTGIGIVPPDTPPAI